MYLCHFVRHLAALFLRVQLYACQALAVVTSKLPNTQTQSSCMTSKIGHSHPVSTEEQSCQAVASKCRLKLQDSSLGASACSAAHRADMQGVSCIHMHASSRCA